MESSIIRSAMVAHESQRKVMDGIIHSAMLTSFQRQGMEGIIRGGYMGKKEQMPVVKGKMSKTPAKLGVVHYQGSRFA
jgi:hypothetical protein